jgi:hypothetical protein
VGAKCKKRGSTYGNASLFCFLVFYKWVKCGEFTLLEGFLFFPLYSLNLAYISIPFQIYPKTYPITTSIPISDI